MSSYRGSADEVLVLTARPLFTLRDHQQLTCNETKGIGQMCKVTLTQRLKNAAVSFRAGHSTKYRLENTQFVETPTLMT